MKTLAHALAFSLVMLIAPAVAFAQDADTEAAETNDILVTGQRPLTDDEARILAQRYVGELTVIDDDETLALYEPDTYCPGVVGMTQRVNVAIRDRMRKVAEAAGVEPAGSDCQTSALVIFVDDKASFIELFRQTHPEYFRSMKERRFTLYEEPGPVVSWRLAQEMDENGNPVQRTSGVSKALPRGVKVVTSYSGGSRLRAMMSTAIAVSVVVIERGDLNGFTIDQLADYALMRTLTDRSPEKLEGSGAPTILTVLSTPMGGTAYGSVTEWDLAYLKERYEGDPRMYGDRKGASLRATLRDVAKTGRDENDDQ